MTRATWIPGFSRDSKQCSSLCLPAYISQFTSYRLLLICACTILAVIAIAPLHKLFYSLKVPLLAHTYNQVGRSGFDISGACFVAVSLLGAATAFDLAAPVIQHLHFVANHLRIAEAMPHIGVLGRDFQRDLLATAADQNRNLPYWPRNIDFPAVLNNLQ